MDVPVEHLLPRPVARHPDCLGGLSPNEDETIGAVEKARDVGRGKLLVNAMFPGTPTRSDRPTISSRGSWGRSPSSRLQSTLSRRRRDRKLPSSPANERRRGEHASGILIQWAARPKVFLYDFIIWIEDDVYRLLFRMHSFTDIVLKTQLVC